MWLSFYAHLTRGFLAADLDHLDDLSTVRTLQHEQSYQSSLAAGMPAIFVAQSLFGLERAVDFPFVWNGQCCTRQAGICQIVKVAGDTLLVALQEFHCEQSSVDHAFAANAKHVPGNSQYAGDHRLCLYLEMWCPKPS